MLATYKVNSGVGIVFGVGGLVLTKRRGALGMLKLKKKKLFDEIQADPDSLDPLPPILH